MSNLRVFVLASNLRMFVLANNLYCVPVSNLNLLAVENSLSVWIVPVSSQKSGWIALASNLSVWIALECNLVSVSMNVSEDMTGCFLTKVSENMTVCLFLRNLESWSTQNMVGLRIVEAAMQVDYEILASNSSGLQSELEML